MGIQCAFCHSTVDNSFAPGIGKRLDAWANRDLNVGAIVSLAPNLSPIANLLGTDVATVRKVLASWGPGCFDAELDKDGKALRPDGKRACTLIPPAFGLAGVNLHTWTGFGSVPYWNAYVGATEMHGSAPLGTSVKIEGPFGNLTLHNNAARAAVLLAGGIGITPFRSIVFRAAHEKLPHRIFLFYSNRRPEDAPFLEELHALEKVNTNYKLIPTITEMEKSQRVWQGERGRINKEMLSRYLKDLESPIYYIAGPPGMVKGLHTMLNDARIDDDDIRTEEFPGY